MYNLRVFHYPGGDHIRVYRNPFRSKGEFSYIGCDEWGEVLPPRSPAPGEVVYNPFTEKREALIDMDDSRHDAERSLRNSIARTRQKISGYARSNTWDMFVTLTFNPDKVDSFDYSLVSKKLSQWLKDVRKRYCPDLKYLVVPELHQSGRYHFHALFADCDGLRLVDSGKRDGQDVIYNIGNYGWGFTTATYIKDSQKASNYIVKYITKDLCVVTAGKKRYWNSRNLNFEEGEEYFLEGVEKAELISVLCEDAVYFRVVEGEYNTVSYIELPGQLDLSGDVPVIRKKVDI